LLSLQFVPKILRIINRFNLGGITYNVSYLSRHLQGDYETLLIGGPEEESEESSLFIPHSLGLEPEIIPELRRSINPFKDLLAYRKIKKIIRTYQPDIVHTHASKAGFIGRLAAFHCGVPVVVHTFHGHVFKGYFGNFKTSVIKNIERYLANKSQAIIAISELQKKELTVKYKISKAEKTHVIPLGFDLSRFSTSTEEKRKNFREKYGVHNSEIAIVIIGRLAPIKNHYLFIDSLAYVKEKGVNNIRAFIVGDGEMKTRLMRYCDEKKLGHSSGPGNEMICFTGWIKEADIPLAGCDLLCLTSDNEGTPVSLIEAQAASRFIVSTDVGGIKDILLPACGFLSPAGNAKLFQENLLRAVQNLPHLQAQTSSAALFVNKKFSYERLCHDMKNLYDDLLSTAKSKS